MKERVVWLWRELQRKLSTRRTSDPFYALINIQWSPTFPHPKLIHISSLLISDVYSQLQCSALYQVIHSKHSLARGRMGSKLIYTMKVWRSLKDIRIVPSLSLPDFLHTSPAMLLATTYPLGSTPQFFLLFFSSVLQRTRYGTFASSVTL